MAVDKDAVLQALNFTAFYQGELQDLKKSRGDEVMALCPFHDDREPSLSINLETGLWNCFGCGAKGDALSFYMQRHGVDFKQALDDLAKRVGVAEVDQTKPGATDFQSLTLAEFAAAKKLPIDFLKANGVLEYAFPDGAKAVDFPYRDQAGKLLAVRHRFANRGAKKFRWRKGDKLFPYGLWRFEEVRQAGWCLLVEGETDSLTCWLHGIPALGLPGKKTWNRCWEALKKTPGIGEIQFYLWQEPDAADLPREVGHNLPGVLVIQAPPDFKDLSEAHCQRREIKSLLHELREGAMSPPPLVPAGLGFTLDDLGNARRLVAEHGKDLKYCHLSKKWYFWTGKYWSVDNQGEIEQRAKSIVARLYREAAETVNAKDAAKIAQHAIRSSSVGRILAMVRLAQAEPGIPVQPSEFNADPFLLNCLNGTIDLRTGNLQPHRREDLITNLSPVEYDPDASCPQWEHFLYQIMDYKQRPDTAGRMVLFLWQALGYSLTGDCREECLFLLWGGGANGKGTMVNTVAAILGDYAKNTPVESLLSRKRGGEIPADIARLDGPRYVTSSEVDRGQRLAEGLVKALTGRDTITARYLYGEFFDFKPQFKLWMSTNNKPFIKGADDGIWRRIMFIRFPVHFSAKERDADLGKKLMAEATGILNWLVRGCIDWQQNGLQVPPEVTTDIAEYRNEMDVLAEFIEEKCLVHPNNFATASDLYDAYTEWAEESGLKDKEILKQRTFGMCLSERGFLRDKGAKGVRLWRGVGLRVAQDTQSATPEA